MNLYEIFTDKEKQLLNNAGITVENKDYDKEELKRCEMSIEDFIMSHSTKNGDIDKARKDFDSALSKIESVKTKMF